MVDYYSYNYNYNIYFDYYKYYDYDYDYEFVDIDDYVDVINILHNCYYWLASLAYWY